MDRLSMPAERGFADRPLSLSAPISHYSCFSLWGFWLSGPTHRASMCRYASAVARTFLNTFNNSSSCSTLKMVSGPHGATPSPTPASAIRFRFAFSISFTGGPFGLEEGELAHGARSNSAASSFT